MPVRLLGLVVLGAVLAMPLDASAQTARPNIVLIFPDNLGWGEVGAYGSVRGRLTPRIDKLAAEGIRLNNFNVEFSCVVSRAALDRKSTRLNSSHLVISYAVFCLKKKKKMTSEQTLGTTSYG